MTTANSVLLLRLLVNTNECSKTHRSMSYRRSVSVAVQMLKVGYDFGSMTQCDYSLIRINFEHLPTTSLVSTREGGLGCMPKMLIHYMHGRVCDQRSFYVVL